MQVTSKYHNCLDGGLAILDFRLVSFHVTTNYPAFVLLTALGTGFFPVGVRAG